LLLLEVSLKQALAIAAALLASVAAHASPMEVYAAGDIADCSRVTAAESDAAATARLIPAEATVLVLGDALYLPPTLANYRSCYGPTWGAHLGETIAVPGNHDYAGGRAEAFFEYFDGPMSGRGYFARRAGSWLVIGLDSNLRDAALDEQYRWLEATLAAAGDAHCTLAMWHAPLYSSGPHRGSGEHMRRFWQALDTFGADLVLNGHEHFYEAFEPRNSRGEPVADGMREFVVGTGGAVLYGFWRPPYSSRARIERHGVLHLTLGDDDYEWQFIDVGGIVADAGRARCR
jgi:3',5'-cyclic AMP phosphodiesterase CpdA